MVRGGMPSAEPEGRGPRCAGCGSPIADRFYVVAAERAWHGRCLTCCRCRLRLDSELTCFARDANIYCKDDYYRLFAVKRCARCQRGIFASELVMRARDLVYHLHCFTCAWCNAALTQGDHFGLRDHLVYCRAHYELVVQGDGAPLLPPPNAFPALLHDPASFPAAAVRKGRPRKRKGADARDALLPQTMLLDAGEGCGGLHLSPLEGGSGLGPAGSQRTKRMRTSFKHHQLRTMKSYFAINQNPDAKDLKQLAQKTGLSKRVLQNARAKWRRNNLRQSDLQPSSQNPQQQPSHSPGANSSFSEEASPPLEQPPAPDYGPDGPSPSGGEALPLASFQELF